MTRIKCPVRDAAMISPRQPAIIREGLQLTYYDFDLCVDAVVGTLSAEGIQKGSRVGLLMINEWYYPVFLMALFRLGAVACPLSTRLPREGLQEHLEMIECKILLATTKDGVARKELWGCTVLNPEPLIPDKIAPAGRGETLYLDLENDATILFTSGSSGRPKAVLHSLGGHYYNAEASNRNIHLSSGDRWVLDLPLYHVSGMGIFFRCILAGAAMVFPAQKDSLGNVLLMYQATHLSMVPTQLYRMLRNPPVKDAIAHLKAVLVGGGPAGREMLAEAIRLKVPLFPTYGMTEMASQITTIAPASSPEQRLTSGKALESAAITIGDRGEILVKGRSLCRGFVDHKKVLPVVDQKGWYHTGDVGSIGPDRYLTVLGRLDNQFISGGENIQPEEIEAAMTRLIGVVSCVVVPVPSAEFGSRPFAFVEMAEGVELNPEELHNALLKFLPKFKIPDHFVGFPPSGNQALKPSRPELAALARTLLDKG